MDTTFWPSYVIIGLVKTKKIISDENFASSTFKMEFSTNC